MNKIVMDFETRSAAPLKDCGAFVYAEHHTTTPMCLSLALNNEAPLIWAPDYFASLVNWDNITPERIDEDGLLYLIHHADEIVAQNSMFEYVMWNICCKRLYGWPELPLEKLHDTMAQLAYHSLPQGLDQAAQALNLAIKKDKVGHKTMLRLCKPRTPKKAEKKADPEWASKLWWDETPEKIEIVFNYCGQDVETERLVHNTLPDLPAKERKVWLMSERINLRGVKIDEANVEAIVKCIAKVEQEQLIEFQKHVKGAVSGPRSYVKLKEWVNAETGLQLTSVSKDAIAELLESNYVFPDHVQKALDVTAELSKSSVAKFKAMLSRRSADGRVRGWGVYHGASTGRWAARGLQLHNNPRDSYYPADYERVLELFEVENTGLMSLLYADPYAAASKCIRGSLVPERGSVYVCSDFSSVEGRGLVYLAGEWWVIDEYRAGKCMYCLAASNIFGVPYDEIHAGYKDGDPVMYQYRLTGKVSDLALGFNGGIGAYASMARSYKVDLEKLPALVLPNATHEEMVGPYGAEALAKAYVKKNPDTMSLNAAISCDVVKRKWRAARPNVQAFWKGLETAARSAVDSPGKIFSYRSIKYCVDGAFLKCLLPSNRVLHYYQPRISRIKTDWEDDKRAVTFMGMKVVDGATTRQWTRLPTYGGKLAENVTQAFCRDLLSEGMLRLEADGLKPMLHVHDEAVVEVRKGEEDLNRFNKIMEVVPPWASGMPIAAEGWVGTRYRK